MGVPTDVRLITGVDAPILGNTDEVETGARVNSLFLNVQVVGTDAAGLHNAYFIIYKNPGDNINAPSIPNANATGSSTFKRQIFHTEMGMLSDDGDSIPVTLFKGVLKIPRSFQNMRISDLIQIQLFSSGSNFDYCVECIYKEIR